MNFPLVSDSFDWASFATSVLNTDNLGCDFQERLHLEWTVRGHRIRQSFANDGKLIAFLRRGLPPYYGSNLVLYRGENLGRLRDGIIGLSWTTSEATARIFGRGLNTIHEGGVLLKTVASSEAIIAGPSQHSLYLNESEFTVEPALLSKVETIDRFDPIN